MWHILLSVFVNTAVHSKMLSENACIVDLYKKLNRQQEYIYFKESMGIYLLGFCVICVTINSDVQS